VLPVIPVDIAVNQILALTAATHNSSKRIELPHGSNVPIYHIAAGLAPNAAIKMLTFNDPANKIAEPYVPAKSLLRAYGPMITRLVKFDTARTRQTIGLPSLPGKPSTLRFGAETPFGVTAPLSDAPVDASAFDLDQQKAFDECGGFTGYLQMVRDLMDRQEEPDSYEAHVD
jgi:hypothetical protein